MKRLSPWQQEKQRTAKGLRELPKCELCRINRGFGWGRLGHWLCVPCAMDELRTKRAAAPRES